MILRSLPLPEHRDYSVNRRIALQGVFAERVTIVGFTNRRSP